jgi:hypothetical protein
MEKVNMKEGEIYYNGKYYTGKSFGATWGNDQIVITAKSIKSLREVFEILFPIRALDESKIKESVCISKKKAKIKRR